MSAVSWRGRIGLILLSATLVPALSLARNEKLLDQSSGEDWAGFGRTYGEQHYSPLTDIDAANVKALGLAWSLDLAPGNTVTGPIGVDGMLYFASGYSIVHAVDARTGTLLWTYDPKAPEAAGHKLRKSWGSRGIAYWNGKLYTGTVDGRLIAVDAKTGKPVWSVMTIGRDDVRYITAAPRTFAGKVIIGHGGADAGPIRGYVTAYDAENGAQLWRFYTVPGNPADGFENPAMEMAAKTWAGEWWKYGGGGTAWNAISYDPETDSLYIGTGNGAPWNHRIRSAGRGDNLFLSSIVALDGKTGTYKWHYQTNPGETWDYNSANDMELAELKIDGVLRKVLMTAPKNGFFYVIDRTNGKLISAEPIAKVTWASKIDLTTGRPVENPAARYPDGTTFTLWPSPQGAHTWFPMAFSTMTGLVYLPVNDMAMRMNDKGIVRENWKHSPGMVIDNGVNLDFATDLRGSGSGVSRLLAWDPIRQKEAWTVPTPGMSNGGVLATAGNLVFQGQVDRQFNAYAADSGKLLWSFDAKAAVLAPPISYRAGGRQYVTVLTGSGTSASYNGPLLKPSDISDYRTQARRVLSFAMGGKRQLPPAPPFELKPPEDPTFKPDAMLAQAGARTFGAYCISCHGVNLVANGAAPDLRASVVPLSGPAFAAIVRNGDLISRGMPRFPELNDEQIEAMRQYIRTEARAVRSAALSHQHKVD